MSPLTRMIDRLKQERLRAIRDELRPTGIADEIPERYLANFTNLVGAAEHVHVITRLIPPPPARVLVVGTFGGRDFWGLRARGYDVTGMNLTDDPECPPTIVADAEGRWPFEDGAFDVIVAGEILEHLFDDRAALLEARRVLRDDGALVVTVPFLHDNVEWHVRVHTRPSIHRLLEHSGFAVQRCVERPGVPLKRAAAVAVNATNLLRRAAGLPTNYAGAARAVGELELKLGERESGVRRVLGALGLVAHGCTIVAHKAHGGTSYKELNVRAFGS